MYLASVRGQQETLHADEYCHPPLNAFVIQSFFSSTHQCLLLFDTSFVRNASCLGCVGPDSKSETEMQLAISTVHDFKISLGLSLSNYRENIKISLFTERVVQPNIMWEGPLPCVCHSHRYEALCQACAHRAAQPQSQGAPWVSEGQTLGLSEGARTE